MCRTKYNEHTERPSSQTAKGERQTPEEVQVCSGGYLGQEFQQDLLPLGEGALHLATDKESVDDSAQKTKEDLVLDDVADERPGYSFTRFRVEFVTVMPLLEWTLVLHIGKVIIPFEFGDACDPPRAHRRKGTTRNDVTIVEPTPAALSPAMPAGRAAGVIRFRTISLASLDAGMIRGRFSGLEKN